MNLDVRTIEVLYDQESTPDRDPLGTGRSNSGRWIARSVNGLEVAKKKKKPCVKAARSRAKNLAKRQGHSVEVKIFKKNGDYQTENVYDP